MTFPPWSRSCRTVLAGCLAALAATAAMSAPAELPVDQLTVTKLPAADANRVYISDPTMGHLVDGRLHVVDGNTMRYLGMLGMGFAGQSALSTDKRELYVASTYHSRLQRGTRTDVIEAYGSDDLTFKYEIEIPPKHAEALQIRGLLTPTPDGRFLLVQNATPATSVTVVDLQQKRVAAEIATPGCWGVIPWPQQPRRFSAVCGDGTLATFELDDKGAQAKRTVSTAFFDPDKDPIFMHFEPVGNRLYFVSYHGQVYGMELADPGPKFDAPWLLVPAADKKNGWQPGGYQLFTIRPDGKRLYVGMHDHASEGSHKTPAKQIWVYDLATHQRIARTPGYGSISMSVSRSDQPRLFVLDGEHNALLSFDIVNERGLQKPLNRLDNLGETPVHVELH